MSTTFNWTNDKLTSLPPGHVGVVDRRLSAQEVAVGARGVAVGARGVAVGARGVVRGARGAADGARAPQRPGAQHGAGSLHAGPEAERDRVLGRLLPLQGHLGRHDALTLGDQPALGARAVAEAAVTFVTLEPRDEAVVTAACALRLASAALRRRVDGRRRHVHGGERTAGWVEQGAAA